MGYSRVLNAISPGVPSTMNMREQNRLLAKVLPNPTAATTKYVPQPFLPIILGEDLVLPCQLHDLKVSHSKSWHPSLQVSVHWVLVSYLRMMWFFFQFYLVMAYLNVVSIFTRELVYHIKFWVLYISDFDIKDKLA